MQIASTFAALDAPADARLVLAFDARRKSRLLARLPSGEEFAYALAPGSVLHGGDKLATPDGRVVEIVAAVEPLLEVRAQNAQALARAAYHLGNRHVPVAVGDGVLHLQRDHVLADMLAGLGCVVTTIEAPFDPEGGAYSTHAHAHSGDHPAHALNDPGHGPHRTKPKIHQFTLDGTEAER